MTKLLFDLLSKDTKAEIIQYLDFKDLTKFLKVCPSLSSDESLWLSVITIHNNYYPSNMVIDLSESNEISYHLLYLRSIMTLWTFQTTYEIGDDPNDTEYNIEVNCNYNKALNLSTDDMISNIKCWLLDYSQDSYDDNEGYSPLCKYLIENDMTDYPCFETYNERHKNLKYANETNSEVEEFTSLFDNDLGEKYSEKLEDDKKSEREIESEKDIKLSLLLQKFIIRELNGFSELRIEAGCCNIILKIGRHHTN